MTGVLSEKRPVISLHLLENVSIKREQDRLRIACKAVSTS